MKAHAAVTNPVITMSCIAQLAVMANTLIATRTRDIIRLMSSIPTTKEIGSTILSSFGLF